MLIAFLTDFGNKDYFVGAMKGVILSLNPEARIIDITHEIEPQNIQSAGFVLASCYQNFPNKTIFVSVVDPGVGSTRRAILVEITNYFFIAPDNGLLSLVLTNEDNYNVFELTESKFFNHPVSTTFHGRDIFAPVAAWLSKGTSPDEVGDKIENIILDHSLKPQKISETETQGQIIHIDNFGNLITNLKKEDLPQNFYIEVNGRIIAKHQTFYAENEQNEIFSVYGSAGYLEIVSFCNSAQKLLEIRAGSKVKAVFS